MIELQIKTKPTGIYEEMCFYLPGMELEKIEQEIKQDIKDLYNFKCISACTLYGDLDLPLIRPCKKAEIKNLISFNYALTCKNPKDTYLHFYIDDYQFERIWANPQRYMELFKKFAGVIMPDFSLYFNLPKAVQIYNHYRNCLLASYYQANGINVIPNVSWSDSESFNWCLTAIPKNSIIAISSNGCLNKATKQMFKNSLLKAIKELKPKHIICVGTLPDEVKNSIPKNIKITIFSSHSNILNQKRGA